MRDGSDVSELMEIFVEDSSYNHDKFPHKSGSKYRFKETEGGRQVMCEIMERLREEDREEGKDKGAEAVVSMRKEIGLTG